MSAALYVRTLDGVLLRFERVSQARDWLARGRLTLSDQYMAADGRWHPILDLIDLERAVMASDPGDSELAGAVHVPPEEGARDGSEEVQRAPGWATTTDELLPIGPVDEPIDEGPAVTVATDLSGEEGPVAWALPQNTSHSGDGASDEDRHVLDGALGGGPTRKGLDSDEIATVRPSDEVPGAAADVDVPRSSWGRRVARLLGIVVLAVLAGYAAWHWGDVAKQDRPARIPDPLALAETSQVSGAGEVAARQPKAEGEGAGDSVKAGAGVVPEAPAVAPEAAPTQVPAAEPVAPEAPARRPEPAPAKAPAQVQSATERPAPVVREAPAPRERPAPAQPPAPRETPEPRAFAGMTFDQHMEQGNRLRTSDPERAMTHFSAAAALKPGQVAPVAALGDCAARLDKRDQAQRYYARALRIRDSYGPALIGMARLHKQAGDTGTALGFYRRYLEVNSRGSQAGEARAFVEAHGAP